MLKRLLSACSVACMLLLSMSACSSGETVIVGEGGNLPEGYGNYTLTEGMYRYWMISWKDYYIQYYSDVEDTPEYWNAMATEELTNEEYLTANIQTRILYYYVAQPLFDELGLKKNLYKDSVKEDLDAMIAMYDSKADCNKALDEKYGIKLSELERVYTFEKRYQAVFDYLYGSSGVERATSAEIDAYYQNYYSRVKYVLFLKNQKYRVDEDGKRVTDSKGYYILDDLTDEEKAEVKALAEKVRDELSAGVTYEKYSDPMDYYVNEYMEQYYEDVLSTYPNGFYITADEYALHTVTVTEAALAMEIGEISLVENEDCYFVIKKYDLIDGAYNSATDSAQFTNLESYAGSEKFVKYFSKLTEDITFSGEITEKYRLSGDLKGEA